MSDTQQFQVGQIVRYTDDKGDTYDAIIETLPRDGQLVIRYKLNPRVVRRSEVSITTLSIPR